MKITESAHAIHRYIDLIGDDAYDGESLYRDFVGWFIQNTTIPKWPSAGRFYGIANKRLYRKDLVMRVPIYRKHLDERLRN